MRSHAFSEEIASGHGSDGAKLGRGGLTASVERMDKLRQWGRLGAKFVAGQATLQILNLLTGFFVLRWLTKEDYAQFSFAFGIQAMLAMLLDLGSSGAITALVGARTGDPAIVGGYTAAAKALRLRLACLVLPLGGAVFFLAGAKHEWPLPVTGLLLCSALAAVFAQGNASIHAAPLLMQRRLGAWYGIGILGALGRLLATAALQGVGLLTGWLTAWVNMLATWGTGVFFKRQARDFCAEPRSAPEEMRREMGRYLAPLIPGVVFTAFQGQITIFLITFFGRVDDIAEVAALGRVGQIFVLLAAFNGVILQPHMAALPAARVLSRYLMALMMASLAGGVICALGSFWPEPLLWLLGPKYAHLGSELQLLLLASTLHYLGGVMWTVHSARKWIFWWSTWLYIGGTVAGQAVFIATHEMNTTVAAMEFAVWSAGLTLVVHASTAIYALSRRARD